MSYGSIPRTPPVRPKHPTRTATTPPTSTVDQADYFSSPRRDSGAYETRLAKRSRRGKSPHDILNHGEGVISSEERSGQFKGIPLEETEIAKLPRKARYLPFLQ